MAQFIDSNNLNLLEAVLETIKLAYPSGIIEKTIWDVESCLFIDASSKLFLIIIGFNIHKPLKAKSKHHIILGIFKRLCSRICRN